MPAQWPDGAVLHVNTGLYAGPFTFGQHVRVEGHGEVVLTGEAGQTVVTASDTELVGVSVQGGDVGLEAGAGVRLSKVHFSGQRKRVARVHGALVLEDSEILARLEGIDGVGVDRGATLTARHLTFSGGIRRALQTEGGRLELEDVRAEGVKTLVHAVEADVALDQASARAGTGPAFFFAAGRAHLRAITVQGHEYGLQLARGAEVDVDGLTVGGTAQGCVSVLHARLTLAHAELTRCGLGAALELTDSDTTATLVNVSKTPDLGVLVRQGALTLTASTFSFISGSRESLGDAVHVRDAKVRLDGLRVTDVEGSGLFVSSLSEVSVGSLEVERARQAAVFVERGSQVRLEKLLVRGGGGPAVVVPDGARVQVVSLSVAGGNDLPIYAECRADAQVEVGRLESTVPQLESQCITPLRAR